MSKEYRLILSVFLGSILLFLTACDSPQPQNPEWLSQQLKEGKDVKINIERVGNLPEKEDRKKCVPALIEVYNKGEFQREVIQVLAPISDTDSEAVLIDAVSKGDPRMIQMSAAALARMESKDAVPELVKAYNVTKDKTAKDSILGALVELKDPRATDLFISVFNILPEKSFIRYHRLACRGLGEIGDPKAIDSLIYGLYIFDGAKRNIFQDCSLALVKIGNPAVDPLLDLVTGKKVPARIKSWVLTQKLPEVIIKYQAMQVLGLIRSKKAEPIILAELNNIEPVQIPGAAETDDVALRSWTQYMVEYYQAMIWTLGDVGGPDAIPALINYLKYEKEYAKKYEILVALGPVALLSFRANPARALAYLGNADPLVRDAIFDVLKNGVVELFKGFGEGVEHKLRQDVTEWFAMLAKPEDLERYKVLIAEEQDALTKQNFERYLPALEAEVQCKEDPACWEQKLVDPNFQVRAKAAYELGRIQQPRAVEALARNLTTDDLSTRANIIYALHRNGTPTMIPTIDEIIEKERGKKGGNYSKSRWLLQILKARLLRKE